MFCFIYKHRYWKSQTLARSQLNRLATYMPLLYIFTTRTWLTLRSSYSCCVQCSLSSVWTFRSIQHEKYPTNYTERNHKPIFHTCASLLYIELAVLKTNRSIGYQINISLNVIWAKLSSKALETINLMVISHYSTTSLSYILHPRPLNQPDHPITRGCYKIH